MVSFFCWTLLPLSESGVHEKKGKQHLSPHLVGQNIKPNTYVYIVLVPERCGISSSQILQTTIWMSCFFLRMIFTYVHRRFFSCSFFLVLEDGCCILFCWDYLRVSLVCFFSCTSQIFRSLLFLRGGAFVINIRTQDRPKNHTHPLRYPSMITAVYTRF